MNLELEEIRDERIEHENKETNEPDLLPEYCHYRDEGCEFADSCLSCRFPQCLYDRPGGKQSWLKELRNKEISRLFSGGGWGEKELASLFGLSQRTIQRALKSTLSKNASRPEKSNKGESDANE